MEQDAQGIERNRLYTRPEIRRLVGGGGVMDYLPSKKNEILAGCFRTDYNPKAPDVVLVGKGPRIEGAAERLMEQGTPIPVFLKRHFNEWEYVGHWRATKLDRDQETIARHSPNASRVSGVLFMEPSEP
jgi:hypothetical protein